MNFALEHNFGAKTVFPKIDVFSNGSAKIATFRLHNRGLFTVRTSTPDRISLLFYKIK
jgi:hypothetical protein